MKQPFAMDMGQLLLPEAAIMTITKRIDRFTPRGGNNTIKSMGKQHSRLTRIARPISKIHGGVMLANTVDTRIDIVMSKITIMPSPTSSGQSKMTSRPFCFRT